MLQIFWIKKNRSYMCKTWISHY